MLIAARDGLRSGATITRRELSFMAIKEDAYIVLQKGRIEKGAGESWLEMLKRWLVECPRCTQFWLVVGARQNDQYICKDCGHSFAIES